jgi:hypothetical protein
MVQNQNDDELAYCCLSSRTTDDVIKNDEEPSSTMAPHCCGPCLYCSRR